ncbi:MAG: 4-hydroxythreonine-4-phosphate dehydrogenase PdxA, partial [Thermodesulfobacteriota bacterium]
TMGDPNGIGPEIVLKSVNDLQVENICVPVVYGSKKVLRKAELETGLTLECEIVDDGNFADLQVEPGVNNKEAGKASLLYIEQAVKDALDKKIDAIVTAPISKESIHLAGSEFPGHTEMLKDLTGAKDAVMLFNGGPFMVALVTIHVSLSDVPKLINKDKILSTIRTCNQDLKHKFKIMNPRIAVCGLNPHAGEAGAFGREEIEEIVPAIKTAINDGINVTGPLPADTLFYRANRGEWDLVIAMYHDQGLIPFKMLAFDTGVNVTLGLPIIRTSPDHGTALDIAWKGIAKPTSMIEAIKLAVKII